MQEQNMKNTPASVSQEDEIDLIQLAKTLWAGRKSVIITTLIFMVLGLFIALFSARSPNFSKSFSLIAFLISSRSLPEELTQPW